MRISSTFVAALAMVAAAGGPAVAGTGWTSVGGTKLDGAVKTATAELRWQTGFREMLVCVEGGAVKLGDATLRLKDGTTKPLKLRTRLDDGACTEPLSVGKNRDFVSVDFAYEGAGAANRLSVVGR
jgi:hypothetical protein